MSKVSYVNQALLSLMAEVFLDESLRQFKEEKLYQEIDNALASKDEDTFLMLTSELKNLQSR
ncbi:MAG: hypothetical protein K0R75_2366 [Paenibacillaceae bacterium]|nr:hypothetical protein [Paenibacillaceae bacterium]